VGRGDPVGLCVGSFTQRDLEVRVHGVTYVPVWSAFIGLHISLNGRLEPLDSVFKGEDHKAVGFFAILDGLDQTGSDVSEGIGIDGCVGCEYVFHGMGQVARWGRCRATSGGGFC